MKNAVQLTYSARTDVGRERSRNEDGIVAYTFTSIANSRPVTCGFFAVSDGMGGHNAGEIASMTAIKSLVTNFHKNYFQKLANFDFYRLPDYVYNYHFKKEGRNRALPSPAGVLKRVIQRANDEIIALSRKNPAFFGMGATLTTAIVTDNQLTVANVGDSRCYIVQDNALVQLTRDHTVVNHLLEIGKITPQEAKFHPGKNFLYKSLGSEEIVDLDVFELELSPPAWIALCSDGLSNMVSDKKILAVLRKSKSPYEATKKLLHLANQAGGKDNISVILVKVTR